eukprot:763314-Hanusia_phi.AAC.5
MRAREEEGPSLEAEEEAEAGDSLALGRQVTGCAISDGGKNAKPLSNTFLVACDVRQTSRGSGMHCATLFEDLTVYRPAAAADVSRVFPPIQAEKLR